jgi:hypothetical protein
MEEGSKGNTIKATAKLRENEKTLFLTESAEGAERG